MEKNYIKKYFVILHVRLTDLCYKLSHTSRIGITHTQFSTFDIHINTLQNSYHCVHRLIVHLIRCCTCLYLSWKWVNLNMWGAQKLCPFFFFFFCEGLKNCVLFFYLWGAQKLCPFFFVIYVCVSMWEYVREYVYKCMSELY